MKDIIFHIFYPTGIKPIQFRMAFRNLQGRTGRFNVSNLRCVGFQCPDSKGSGVRETVEDFPSLAKGLVKRIVLIRPGGEETSSVVLMDR